MKDTLSLSEVRTIKNETRGKTARTSRRCQGGCPVGVWGQKLAPAVGKHQNGTLEELCTDSAAGFLAKEVTFGNPSSDPQTIETLNKAHADHLAHSLPGT